MNVFLIPSWYATEDNPHGGVFFTEQARALLRAGHTVHVLYPDLRFKLGGLPTGVFTMQGDVPGLLCRRRSLTPFWERGRWPQREWMLERLYRQAEQAWGKPDVVHLHACRVGVETVWLCQKHRLPLVYTEHYSGLMKEPRGVLREQFTRTLAGATVAIGVSRALQERMREFRADVSYIPNLVDTTRFSPAPAWHEGFVFGVLGNLIPRKQVDVLLRAFAKADLENARLRIGGDGSEMGHLRKLAVSLHLDGRVEFCGAIRYADTPAFYNACDCLVSASEAETFGMTLIEALSCGVPVLSARSGGPESIVVPGQNGWLVPVGDIDALADGLRKMVKRPFDPVTLREDCITRFGESTVIRQIGEVYQKAVYGYERV
ncbi:MAG: glycosyltransferase [Ethanoligenens sp.]|uniref:glycosyltransferase n=1 Tax=Ethanoligenens sp. TaxID=2099655 RepID=UPI0039E92E71